MLRACFPAISATAFISIDLDPADQDQRFGLLGYFQSVWNAKQTPILRPDMIYFTLISELTNLMSQCPDDFIEHYNPKLKSKVDVHGEITKEFINRFLGFV